MRKVGKSKLLGPLILLSVAAVFIGINVLEAKKPPKWEWRVGIPMAGTECNLYANTYEYDEVGYGIYENNEDVEVEFWTREDRQTGVFKSTFSLRMKNTEKGISDAPGDYSVGFQNVEFIGCICGGRTPCSALVLPNCDDPVTPCCETDCCGTGCVSNDFLCMQDFMNNNVHPGLGYDHFGLRLSVYYDIESMGPGDTWEGEGYLWWIKVWNTSETLISGDEQYHNIFSDPYIPLEDVFVSHPTEDEWIITVDQCGPKVEGECEPSAYYSHGRYIGFWEMYYQGILKGNSHKFDSEWRWALGARTPFKFVTKWTRVPK